MVACIVPVPKSTYSDRVCGVANGNPEAAAICPVCILVKRFLRLGESAMASLTGDAEPLTQPRGKGTSSLLPITRNANVVVPLARLLPRGLR